MKNKKTKVAIIGIIALVVVTIGITYAYWLITRTQQGENVITTGCLDIALTDGDDDITLADQFPLSDEDGMKLTPYTFTVTNNCNTSVDYQVNLESIGSSSSSISATSLKAVLNENVPKLLYDYVGASTTVSDAYEAYTLGYGTLASKDSEGSSASYSLRIWIDEEAPISEMNKTFKSKISVTIGQGISAEGEALATLILDDAEEKGYLKTETPNFSQVTADGEYGLYSAQDDSGTSYYFRGDVENNYVKLGIWKETESNGWYGCYEADQIESCFDGPYETKEECESTGFSNGSEVCYDSTMAKENDVMYWRIVRINGDGTIRLVYDGTSAVENGIKHVAATKKIYFNDGNEEEKFVGYTYDDGNDSIIKDYLEDWYETNLKSDYYKYLADEIFCNDKSVYSVIYYGPDGEPVDNIEEADYYDKVFSPSNRLSTKTPVLTCTNQSDRYTVKDSNGNSLLTNPIGLLTADEVVMAGAVSRSSNENYYLYSGDNTVSYWTMSPSGFDGQPSASVFVYGNSIGGSEPNWDYKFARPVINLKADVQFTGNGTIDSPYEIVTE